MGYVNNEYEDDKNNNDAYVHVVFSNYDVHTIDENEESCWTKDDWNLYYELWEETPCILPEEYDDVYIERTEKKTKYRFKPELWASTLTENTYEY